MASPSATADPAGTRRRRFTVDALFADHRPQAVGVADLPTAKEIRLDRIEPDPAQPRRTFDSARLDELAASIAIEGVLQPIVVRYDAPRDVYVIVHGERRWRAGRQAGLSAIPAIVRDVPDDRRLIQQLMENVAREDLNAVDRAAALRALKMQLGEAPWEQVAEAVGIRRSRLFQLLGTAKLPDSIQEDIRAGRLSEKQSRALQGLPPGHQQALRDAILADDLPAEEALRLARALRAARVPDDPPAAAAALAALRAGTPHSPAPAEDETATLLAAVAAAASGDRAERAALARTADAYGLPSYDPDRLRAEVLALARTLARAPAAELRPGTPAHAALAALYGALDAALGS
jgi:ParB family chromosome partitioning protein